MSNSRYSRLYRNLTQKILKKMVTPQVLGSTAELEQHAQQQQTTPVCYVLQDDSLSNTLLINEQTKQRHLPAALAPLRLGEQYEENSMLILNEQNPKEAPYHYPAKLIRLIEALEQNPELDIQCVPVTVLWGRAPDYEDSWFKALFSDAWSTPSQLKQAINVSLYSKDSYLEFHKGISLRQLLQQAKVEHPNYSPAHFIVESLAQNLNKYKEAILGPDLSDRRNLINQLMQSEAIQHAITKESIDKKVSMFEAENRAKGYLTEIVSDFSYATLRFAALSLEKLWTQLYDGIEVHNFDTVRELAKDYEIVYTPCHRSHIDYLLLSYVIFNRGLMVPHIAAGINLNLPVVGNILRGAGAYFIRRSFHGNLLYTAVFKEYVHSLLTRNSPIEYFIEGGRSRTGLLLPPKKGMLSMTIHSHLRGATKPIAFIPTYFGYEKLFEGASYLNELNGKPKEAESIWGLLGTIRHIEKVFGLVHVNFGEPVFLDDILTENNARHLTLGINDELPTAVVNSIQQTGNAILENINKAAVINPIALLSLVLLNVPQHRITEQALIQQLNDYRQLLKSSLYDSRMMMTELSSPEIIEYALKLKQVERHDVQGEAFIQVSDKQKSLLNYFSNNILHCFIVPAFIALTLSQTQQVADVQAQLASVYPYFKEELFLKWRTAELHDYVLQVLNSFSALGWIEQHDDQIVILNAQCLDLLANLARPSLMHYMLMAELMAEYAREQSVDLTVIEKMSKAAIKKLRSLDVNGLYFDKSTLKSFSNVLKDSQLAEVKLNKVQLKADTAFSQLQHFDAYLPEYYQQLQQVIQFNEKEIKQFFELKIK